MQQMVNSSAPVLERIPFGRLSGGFFRRSCDQGKVLFAGQSGHMVFSFPVLEDGSISKHGHGCDQPECLEEIEVIDPKELGIAEIKWAD